MARACVCGKSNSRNWPMKLAHETGLEIAVCHLPPGTSKWNKIEHRLFLYLSQNRRDIPLPVADAMESFFNSTIDHTGRKAPRPLLLRRTCRRC